MILVDVITTGPDVDRSVWIWDWYAPVGFTNTLSRRVLTMFTPSCATFSDATTTPRSTA